MYSDILMRFINIDPARQGLDWYESRADNPITNVDPKGTNVIMELTGPTLHESSIGTNAFHVTWNFSINAIWFNADGGDCLEFRQYVKGYYKVDGEKLPAPRQASDFNEDFYVEDHYDNYYPGHRTNPPNNLESYSNIGPVYNYRLADTPGFDSIPIDHTETIEIHLDFIDKIRDVVQHQLKKEIRFHIYATVTLMHTSNNVIYSIPAL